MLIKARTRKAQERVCVSAQIPRELKSLLDVYMARVEQEQGGRVYVSNVIEQLLEKLLENKN